MENITLEDIADIKQFYRDALFTAMNYKKDYACLAILDEMTAVVGEARRMYSSRQ
jgi:hypothetical protein